MASYQQKQYNAVVHYAARLWPAACLCWPSCCYSRWYRDGGMVIIMKVTVMVMFSSKSQITVNYYSLLYHTIPYHRFISGNEAHSDDTK